MARVSDKDRVKSWQQRVDAANKVYGAWEDLYRCDLCEEYYEGHQWPDEEEGKYTINLVFPTVELKIPSLFFNTPRVKITPKPAHSDDLGSKAADRAKLQQDTVNTFMGDRTVGLRDETLVALKESFWRFGVLEVGHTADFIDNPNVGKPVLKDDDTPMLDKEGKEIPQPSRILKREQLYVKRIPANSWRVSAHSKQRLEQCDWCGYYEYHYPEDLRRNKRYQNTATLKRNATVKAESLPPSTDNDDEMAQYRDMVKIWKIWDIRQNKRYVWADGGEKFLLDGETVDYLPFAALKHHDRSNSWYPIPPIFNWISPQDELNETRDMQKVHRKRFKRRYMKSEAVEDKEMQKLEDGEDGTWITVPKASADGVIVPIQDAPLDQAVARNVPQSREDLREISGEGGEQRGIPESETATQANIINVRSQIRESFSRQQIGNWMAQVGLLILFTVHKHLALPIWIKISVDPTGPNAVPEALKVAETWKEITSKDLGDLNLDVTVDVSTLSPLSREQERNNFFQGLTVMTNPQFAPILAVSDTLMRKALSFFDISGETEVQEIKRAVAINMMLQMQALAAKNGIPGVNPNPAPGPTPDNPDIARQIGKQIGTGA